METSVFVTRQHDGTIRRARFAAGFQYDCPSVCYTSLVYKSDW